MTLFTFILSCTPVNLITDSKDLKKTGPSPKEYELNNKIIENNTKENQIPEKEIKNIENIKFSKQVTLIFSNKNDEKIIKQFINVIELAVYNKNLQGITFEIKIFNNQKDLEDIISQSSEEGKIFIGPIDSENTRSIKKFCDKKVVFFSFSSEEELAADCIYLFNFFPRNELTVLFNSLNADSKIALLYPENNYGYLINSIIDDIVNQSDAILINRASYKNDLSNVRDAIKELGKYELRKYELNRQKQILISKKDDQSKKRLKKLEKFKTTSDYDFTHVLIADYGLNLLQVAPLLPYYDIDPNIVQFLGTGVIDDKNFFFEPSLQGAIFPGIEINKRIDLIEQYLKIYDENLLRISTLSYDLVGLLDFIYSNNMSFNNLQDLLNNTQIKFDGIDGEFFFQNNIIQRNLDILKISNGTATKINLK